MDVMVSMKWQVIPGMGGNFEPELYIAFRSYPATRSGRAAQTAALGRNTWQLRPGTGGNFPPEWVADLSGIRTQRHRLEDEDVLCISW